MNKKRVLDEEDPNDYQKPVADSDSNKATQKKRAPKNLPSDNSTDYEAGEEEETAISGVGLHMAGEKMKNLTSRQRAMLKGGKDSGKVEFPEGLPPAPSRSKNRNVIFSMRI
jgi:polynucleotide 5'-kinase involved in rRNA processing